MPDRLCLLSVHAHPDDEASKGPATVAKYHHQGVRTVLVCCTGGEEGDILNPAMDMPEVRADIASVRRRELATAAEIIGYDEVVHLGYRDSGMADTPQNDHPDCFARADLDEAVARLVAVVRRERPQVVITYGEDHQGYPHPDHIRVHEVSVAAFAAAADPGAYPDSGEAWQPRKLYYSGWSGARILAMHEKFEELGLESPFDEAWLERAGANAGATTFSTVIDVAGFTDIRRQALLAHATQVDPTSPFWFGLPPEVMRSIYPIDEYELAQSLVAAPEGAGGEPEDDLFAGVRDLAAR